MVIYVTMDKNDIGRLFNDDDGRRCHVPVMWIVCWENEDFLPFFGKMKNGCSELLCASKQPLKWSV